MEASEPASGRQGSAPPHTDGAGGAEAPAAGPGTQAPAGDAIKEEARPGAQQERGLEATGSLADPPSLPAEASAAAEGEPGRTAATQPAPALQTEGSAAQEGPAPPPSGAGASSSLAGGPAGAPAPGTQQAPPAAQQQAPPAAQQQPQPQEQQQAPSGQQPPQQQLPPFVQQLPPGLLQQQHQQQQPQQQHQQQPARPPAAQRPRSGPAKVAAGPSARFYSCHTCACLPPGRAPFQQTSPRRILLSGALPFPLYGLCRSAQSAAPRTRPCGGRTPCMVGGPGRAGRAAGAGCGQASCAQARRDWPTT